MAPSRTSLSDRHSASQTHPWPPLTGRPRPPPPQTVRRPPRSLSPKHAIDEAILQYLSSFRPLFSQSSQYMARFCRLRPESDGTLGSRQTQPVLMASRSKSQGGQAGTGSAGRGRACVPARRRAAASAPADPGGAGSGGRGRGRLVVGVRRGGPVRPRVTRWGGGPPRGTAFPGFAPAFPAGFMAAAGGGLSRPLAQPSLEFRGGLRAPLGGDEGAKSRRHPRQPGRGATAPPVAASSPGATVENMGKSGFLAPDGTRPTLPQRGSRSGGPAGGRGPRCGHVPHRW